MGDRRLFISGTLQEWGGEESISAGLKRKSGKKSLGKRGTKLPNGRGGPKQTKKRPRPVTRGLDKYSS